jgi:ABC-type sugar transport system ATPase subunit
LSATEGAVIPQETTGQPEGLGIRAATHDYSGVVVLRNVSFEMQPGGVHGLAGENGSGKSTLIRILTGVVVPSSGELYLGGEPVVFSSPADAQRRGVGVVHEDYHLFPELSVADNVFGVGKAPPHRKLFPFAIDRGRVRREVWETLSALGVELSPETPVRDLDAAQRKFVEIARAMLLKPRFLILDEPTASLEPRAAESALAVLSRLRAQGVGLAFVSHRLDEVLKISDEVTVLRDGNLVAFRSAAGLTEDGLAALILGYKHTSERTGSSALRDEVALELTDTQVDPSAPPISFTVKRGEIFGLTGLVGAGASRLIRMIGGAEPLTGTLKLDGKVVRIGCPRDASSAGIGFVPEDRKGVGLVGDQSVAINISLASLGQVSSFGWLHLHKIDSRGETYRRQPRGGTAVVGSRRLDPVLHLRAHRPVRRDRRGDRDRAGTVGTAELQQRPGPAGHRRHRRRRNQHVRRPRIGDPDPGGRMLLISAVENGLDLKGVNDDLKQVVIGIVFIVAASGDFMRRRLQRSSATKPLPEPPALEKAPVIPKLAYGGFHECQ